MKKIFLMLASLAFALAAGAKEVKVTVAISHVAFAEDSYVKVEGVSSDVTVVINGTECVFDGTTGKWKSGEPEGLRAEVFPVSVRIPESPLSLALDNTKFVVVDKDDDSIASTLSLSCDGVSIDYKDFVKTVGQLKALYEDGESIINVANASGSGTECFNDDELLSTVKPRGVCIYNKSTNTITFKKYENR